MGDRVCVRDDGGWEGEREENGPLQTRMNGAPFVSPYRAQEDIAEPGDGRASSEAGARDGSGATESRDGATLITGSDPSGSVDSITDATGGCEPAPRGRDPPGRSSAWAPAGSPTRGGSPVDATTGLASRDSGSQSASSAPAATAGDGGSPGRVHGTAATRLPGASPRGGDAAREAEVGGGVGGATRGDAGGSAGEGDACASGRPGGVHASSAASAVALGRPSASAVERGGSSEVPAEPSVSSAACARLDGSARTASARGRRAPPDGGQGGDPARAAAPSNGPASTTKEAGFCTRAAEQVRATSADGQGERAPESPTPVDALGSRTSLGEGGLATVVGHILSGSDEAGGSSALAPGAI